MVTLIEHPPTNDETTITKKTSQAKENLKTAAIILLLIIGGLTLVLYPTAADWFSAQNHNDEITSYGQLVSELTDEEREHKLQVAHDYNSLMPRGPLRDPFAIRDSAAEEAEAEDAAYAAYEEVLRVSDHGVMGNISYPARGIHLPLYHGTSDEVISKGVGHLYGSSLPVGGPSTHSVLTAHSGLAHAKLFTPLLDAKLGEEFAVEVLGERHFYRVENILNVEPTDTSALQIVEGKDYVTLITCTPIGINSHRLLVIGERIETPETITTHELPHVEVSAGFPWWIVALIGGTAATIIATFGTGASVIMRRRKRRNQQHDTPVEP